MLNTELRAQRLVDGSPTAIARFWSSVRCQPLAEACWTWRPGCVRALQPSLSIRGQQVQAVRIAHYLVTGEWPLAFKRKRLCDDPLCVRPSHGRWQASSAGRLLRRQPEQHFAEIDQVISIELELATAREAGALGEFPASGSQADLVTDAGDRDRVAADPAPALRGMPARSRRRMPTWTAAG